MSKRLTRFLSLFAALTLVLAACGDGGGTATTEAPDTGTGDTTAPAEDALGTVTIGDGEAIQIRSLNAISGDTATLGIPNQNAVQMAIADYGPIKDHEVDMGTGLDDLCSNEGGQAAAQTIVADEQVLGVIGTSCSGAATAASPLISDAGMSMISPSNTSPALTSDLKGTAGTDYHPGYYRIAHNDLFQGQAVAEFVFNELGLTTAAAIHDGDPYTQGLAQAFSDAFEGLGGTMTGFTAVNKGDTDMSGVLTEVAAGSPEAVYFPIFPPEGNFIAQQVGGVEGLADTTLLAADGMLVENFLEIPESEGIYFSGPSLQFGENANDVTSVSATDFLATYEEEFGEAPTAAFWAHAYDSTILLLSAIDEVAVDNGDGTLTVGRQALRDAITAKTFNGLTGLVACDEFGDCGAQEIQIVSHPDSSVTDSTQEEVVYQFKGEVG
jgi:branched-chain amino acid transport system substrate-binding protein